ncbi:competence protein CoiA [Alkalibacillus haloalkaliphilus]|uniref:competence protein CoiA n=1 Tax=Alkalibacillus haloalkaliphilus TaxID=94136 RepID=UPI00293676B6|nr:competence protein CoiA family protein [Alkalibacillus haloalkaliphilus]MDV2582710.1 competence protein CoiA family protein [Alkalibacillus haloalkaliphilus]
MLKAMNEQGQAVVSFSQPREKLEQMRSEALYCPDCKQPVILKAGEVNIPHFAHRSDGQCRHGQGESDTHLKGKMHLAKWLFQQKHPIYLEYFVKSIQQRADIITKVGKFYYAIEYQCSPIEPQELLKRTEGFLSQQIIPIWIFGPSYDQPLKQGFFKINTAIRTSLLTSPYAKSLRFFTYNPSKFTFSIYYPSTVHQNLAFSSSTTKPITDLSFQDLLIHEPTENREKDQWLLQKRRFRTKQRQFTSDEEKKYLQFLYNNRLHPQYLPSCIYLPVQNYHLYHTPMYVWQTHFIMDVLDVTDVEDAFSWQDLYDGLSDFFYSRLTSAYPNSAVHPLYDYTLKLANLGYIERKEGGTFVKKKDVHYPKTLDEALQNDRELLDQLFNA